MNISSVSIHGSYMAPAYNASKSYMSNYLEGFIIKAKKLNKPIFVTDIQPGFVNTAMAKGDGLFLVAPPEKAANQSYEAIRKRKNVFKYFKKY